MQRPGKEEVIPIGYVRFFQLAKFFLFLIIIYLTIRNEKLLTENSS